MSFKDRFRKANETAKKILSCDAFNSHIIIKEENGMRGVCVYHFLTDKCKQELHLKIPVHNK
jgi:hypothetical protein